jgi:dTDP-4-dehydrorhamnose 3,5-epimerase
MHLTPTPLDGAWVVHMDRHEDPRGFFGRTYCEREFAAHGLCTQWVQSNVSFNHQRGTLRGMHYQIEPHGEEKLVHCTTGAILDVIVDVRPASPTYRQYFAIELSHDNRDQLYIPRGMAHGFLTLADDTKVAYQMGNFYHPESARGFRYDDPAIGIPWPEPVTVISDRDRDLPTFENHL